MLPFAQAQPNKFADIVDALARTPLSKVVLFVIVCTAVRIVLHPMLMKTPTHKRGGGYGFARFANEMLDAVIYAGVFVFLIVRPFGVQTFRIPSESMEDTLLINDFLLINKAVYRYTDPKAGDIVVFRPPAYACNPDQIDTDGQPKVDFIKRCIGVPGEVVEIRNGVLYKNGFPIDDSSFRKGTNQLDFKLVHYQGDYEPWKGQYIPVQYTGQYYNYDIGGIPTRFGVAVRPGFKGTAPGYDDWIPLDQMSPSQRKLLEELRTAEPAPIPKGYFLMMGDNRERSFDGRAWGLVPKADIVGRSEYIWWPGSRWRKTPSIPLNPPSGSPEQSTSPSN